MSLRKALIVEDDAILAKIFAHTLKDVQYETDIVTNGQKAVDYLAETAPDVLILDLHVPFVTGEEILQKVRSEEHLTNVQVVIVTADAIKAKDMKEQNEIVLVKPTSILKLQQIVKDLS